jgi:hypothetical protein
MFHRIEDCVEIRVSVAREERERLLLARRLPQEKHYLGLTVGLELELGLERAARIETRADASGERLIAVQCGWLIERTVAPDEFGAVSGA